MSIRLFTSESVTEGHPDKVCDQIADRILDELIAQDPDSRCAYEVTAEPGAVHIMGEITTKARVNYAACARDVIRSIGYTKPEYGFTDECSILALMLFSENLISNAVWSEVMDIVAWVLIWESVHIAVFQNRELRVMKRRYLSYLSMNIDFLSI